MQSESKYKIKVKGLTLKTDTHKDVEEAKKLLREHFEKCGTVTRVFVKEDFAFIDFETEEARDEAIKLKGSTFQGNPIDVWISKPRKDDRNKDQVGWVDSKKDNSSNLEVKNWSTWY